MFLSIKWKSLIVVAVAIIAVFSLAMFSSISTKYQAYDEEVAERHKINQLAINRILERQVIATLPVLHMVPNNIALLANPDEAQKKLEALWLDLSVSGSVSYVGVFDREAMPLHQVSDNQALTQDTSLVSLIRSHIDKRFSPMTASFLYCDQGCYQFVLEPVLLEDGQIVYAVMGQGLHSLVEEFFYITGHQLGILLPEKHSKAELGLHLPNWQLDAWVLSDFERTSQVLAAFAAKAVLPVVQPAIFEFDKRQLVIQSYEVESQQEGEIMTLIGILDVTNLQTQLQDFVLRSVQFAFLGLLLTLVMLAFWLLKPLQRVIHLSDALKSLSEFDFQRANQWLKRSDPMLLKDELETLEQSVETVVDVLERYHHDIKIQNQELEQQLATIERSRAFLERLFDSADLYILTQTFTGQLLMRNKRLATLLPAETTSIFVMLKPADTKQWQDCLLQLQSGEHQVVSEMDSFDLAAQPHQISWTHTTVMDHSGETVVLSIGKDLTEHKKTETALNWLSYHDPLTQLNNRRAFQERLSSLCKHQANLALVFINIEQFKRINDLFGHAKGDKVLVHLAKQIKRATRYTDYISRWTADEFALILQGMTLDDLEETVEKIAAQLTGQVVVDNGVTIEYQVRLASALFPLHAKTSEELVMKAHMVLLNNKKDHANYLHFYRAEDNYLQDMQKEYGLISAIKDGLKFNRFQLHFQPIQCIATGKITHYETLLRLYDEEQNVISPGQFIPVAEKTGLIYELDLWVIEHALAFAMKTRRTAGYENVQFSINISAPSLQSDTLVDVIAQQLQNNGLAADAIIIEITETAYIENFNRTLNNLESLSMMGCKVAIDDFGVGFSSFNYLRKMPVDYIKLDGSYIVNLLDSPEDQVFVKGIAEMAQGFSMQTIAEFIEDQDMLSLLQSYGVNYAQGFYIGKPKPELLPPN